MSANNTTFIQPRTLIDRTCRPGHVSIVRLLLLLIITILPLSAQTQWELERATIKIGHVWLGVTANGGKGSFDYRAGFFPNDMDILGLRGQEYDVWAGAGFTLTATDWTDSIDTVHTVAVYGPLNDFMSQGKVTEQMTNSIRFGFPSQTVDFTPLEFEDFAEVNPDEFAGKVYDQKVEVTTENILGVQIHRQILVSSQTYHNDYVVVDAEMTNVSADTLHNFYVNIQSNGYNSLRSNGNNPAVGAEGFNPATTWQHYYGGRVGDSLRVFYEYSADDPDKAGDDMGCPVLSQNGRLINTKFPWYSILHASEAPYSDPSGDVDDFLQPKVTYIGKDNLIPYNNSADDEYSSANFSAIRGEYSLYFPMSGNVFPDTYHGGNSDEQNSADYASHPAGTHQANNSKMWSSFGPYTFAPGQKLHFVIASGFSGLNAEISQNIGKNRLKRTLTEAPGLPDATTGYFPTNFVFPTGASDQDKIKDRWISTGIDSVMQSASRAKWNFDHNYELPASPPPPDFIEITGLGTGVSIRWSDADAEALSNFAGYRIMRKLSNLDTLYYSPIYDSDTDDKADIHEYVDKNVLVGAQYYYYIQAKARIADDDARAYPRNRGKILYSSRAMQPNTQWINPPHFTQDDLSKIAIVPNPYNINDPKLANYKWTDDRGIQFFNLPAKIDIRIYTENGDHVITLKHDSPVSSGYELWDMITKNQQVVNSGVYIAVFQTPDGRTSYQKLVIVR